MKKIIFGLAAITLASSALADITIVNPSNKSSPATVFAIAYKDAIGAEKFYQSQTCEDAQKVFSNTENAVMVYNSSIEFAARNKGLNCRLEGVTKEQTIFIGKQYMSVCTAKDSGSTFKDEKVVMGMASMYSTKNHEADFKSNGVNMHLVPFAGSKAILQAVLNKDINYGFIGTSMAQKSIDKLDCLYSTNPADKNYIGNSLTLKVPDFRITLVLYTNSKDPKVLEKLRSAANQENFAKYLQTSGTIADWEISDQDVNSVVKFVDRMESNWAVK